MLSWEWRCSWSSADRRCSNYIWMINNFIAYQGASYITDFTVSIPSYSSSLVATYRITIKPCFYIQPPELEGIFQEKNSWVMYDTKSIICFDQLKTWPECFNKLIYSSYGLSKSSRSNSQPWFFFTHWGLDKMDAISQTTFSSAFSWMKIFWFWLKFHWSLFLRVQLTIFQHWFR